MYKDILGNNYVKLAFHLHTTLTDGQKTPEEVAKIYKADGFDAIALTDHWVYGKEQTLCGLPILSGCEYNLGGGDTSVDVMHIVGVMTKYAPELDRKTATRQEVIDKINAAGGIAIFAHPAWSVNTLEDAKALEGFTGVEIYNTTSEWGENLRAYSDYYVDMCANAGIYYGIMATDDAHRYIDDDRKCFLYVMCETPERDKILEAIKKGDYCASQGPILHVKRDGNKLIVDTTPVSKIGTVSNAAWLPDRVIRGENLTHFEYEIRSIEKWVRVEVTDNEGKKAWSNIFTSDK